MSVDTQADGWFYRALGARILAAREKAGMTQAELGAELSPPVTRAQVAHVEGGKNRIFVLTLLQYANALQTTSEALLPSLDRQKVMLQEAQGLRQRAKQIEQEARRK